MRYDKQNKRFEKLQHSLAECIRVRQGAEAQRDHLYSILDGIMHETRRLNSEIAAACDDLARKIQQGSGSTEIGEDAENIYYTSGLISSRLTFADFEINADAISRQTKFRAGIYKKFDKAKRVLSRSARKKKILIRLEGSSFNEIDVIPAFELVPFVLLDNAIKYSPPDQEITVTFEDRPESSCRTRVTIQSMGPVASRLELPRLIERGMRGTAASRSGIPGEGIGLFLADTLMKLANGRLSISAGDTGIYSVDGIAYAEFRVNLDFY